MANKTPAPPKHLDDAGKQFWLDILDAFDISEPHHLALLTRCSEQLDRISAFRDEIGKTGATVVDRFGQTRANPLLAEERASCNLVRLCLRELNLDSAEPDAYRLPRGVRYGA